MEARGKNGHGDQARARRQASMALTIAKGITPSWETRRQQMAKPFARTTVLPDLPAKTRTFVWMNIPPSRDVRQLRHSRSSDLA